MLKNYFLLVNLLERLSKALAGQEIREVFTQKKNEVILELSEGFLVIQFSRELPFLAYKKDVSRKRQSMSILKTLIGATFSSANIINNKRMILLECDKISILLNLLYGKNGLTVFDETGAIDSVKTRLEQIEREALDESRHITAFLQNEITATGCAEAEFLEKIQNSDELIWYEKDDKYHVCPIEFKSLADNRIVHRGSFLDAYATICFRYTGILNNGTLKENLEKATNKQLRYLEKTIRTIETTLQDEARYKQYEQYGHLILSNLHLVKPYTDSLIVDNYFLNPVEKTQIPIKENLSANENAERYYRKAKAYQKNKDSLEIRLKNAKKKVIKCQEINEKLEKSFKWKELDRIKLEMISLGWIKAETEKEKRQMNTKSVYTIEFEVDGHEVLVGKDSKSNDQLSLKIAKANDIWFHVQGSPGSHVVLRWHGNKDNPPKDLIKKVASLAAHYSKQKNAGTISVIYTQAKYVRKPRGAKSGSVTVQYEKSVFVKPKPFEEL